MKFGTKAVHAGITPDPTTGAIMTPVYQTATYAQTAPGEHKGYTYSRGQNPTRTVLQESIAMLENGRFGTCFSSGMAAIDAIIKLLSPGDEVIAGKDLYGGSYRMFLRVFEKYGIKFHFVDMTQAANVKAAINANTKLIWVETPSNPILSITDIAACCALAKQNKILVAVDNTFASPYLQNPLDLGADIVMHSVTKYLGGHSDVIMGAVVVNRDDLNESIRFIAGACGATPGPQDSFLVLRGIKTLHLRMERHCANGKQVANFLSQHPAIDKIHWPGFADHPNHDIAKKQMRDFGAMLSFTLKDNSPEAAKRMIQRAKLFTLGESLGGVESLFSHPATMSHASVPREERLAVGIADSLIRVSVGVEDINDLLEDLKQALGD